MNGMSKAMDAAYEELLSKVEKADSSTFGKWFAGSDEDYEDWLITRPQDGQQDSGCRGIGLAAPACHGGRVPKIHQDSQSSRARYVLEYLLTGEEGPRHC